MPYFTSIIVRTYSWMVLLGRDGIINQLLLESGLVTKPLPLLYNSFAIVVGMSYILLPYMILTLYAAIKAIDPQPAPRRPRAGRRAVHRVPPGFTCR